MDAIIGQTDFSPDRLDDDIDHFPICRFSNLACHIAFGVADCHICAEIQAGLKTFLAAADQDHLACAIGLGDLDCEKADGSRTHHRDAVGRGDASLSGRVQCDPGRFDESRVVAGEISDLVKEELRVADIFGHPSLLLEKAGFAAVFAKVVVPALAALALPAADRTFADDPVTDLKPRDIRAGLDHLPAPLVPRDKWVFCQPGGDVEHDAVVKLNVRRADGHGFDFDQDIVRPAVGALGCPRSGRLSDREFGWLS
jgi:hypothetical protein